MPWMGQSSRDKAFPLFEFIKLLQGYNEHSDWNFTAVKRTTHIGLVLNSRHPVFIFHLEVIHHVGLDDYSEEQKDCCVYFEHSHIVGVVTAGYISSQGKNQDAPL
ncbi:hypothetical protein CEXT_282902 [Caerostris extrusa]|uniref:Uncharacterized protein n=1 Tax=Caerostris extrusa TaxID=172846 RepID=A0AAV4W251_CAEEX|nr:hypothetical protein CEXT_282902 [Caerostris extrusa]